MIYDLNALAAAYPESIVIQPGKANDKIYRGIIGV